MRTREAATIELKATFSASVSQKKSTRRAAREPARRKREQ
jgi:hypothetical protein